jgi:hypothetical protein
MLSLSLLTLASGTISVMEETAPPPTEQKVEIEEDGYVEKVIRLNLQTWMTDLK